MKKTFIILLMWLPLLLLNAQEKAVYRITYDCHALYDKTPQTYRWNLDIGNSTAVFYNPNHRKHEEAFQSMQKTDDITVLMNSIKQLGSKYPNRSNLEVLIGAPEKETYTYINKLGLDDIFMYEEHLPDIHWELTDSTKTVCSYPCHQAIASVYGRTWSVWYSTELPMPYGPYILGGLPGLILEASDTEEIFHFTCVGIETVHDDTTIALNGEKEAVKCTRKKYLELRKSIASQTYSEIATNVLSGAGKIVKITDASGKDITHQKQSTKNYLDIN